MRKITTGIKAFRMRSLATWLGVIGGKVKIVVSYNKCGLVKEMFKGFYKYNAITDYSVKQKVRRKGIVEWLITNFEIDAEILAKFKNIEYDAEEEI
jgi:hypothetical protein